MALPDSAPPPLVGHSPLRTAWALTRPYFASRGAWAARGLVVAVVALNIGEVSLQVGLSNWNRRWVRLHSGGLKLRDSA
jgi:ABC-type uncharacterized transport system fused permease/ATPase subunit